MKRRLPIITTILSVVLLIAGYATASSGLKDYKPKSSDEEELVSLIISYEDAHNSGNIQRIKDLFCDEGKHMYGPQRIVFTKAEFENVIPKQMADYPVLKFQEPQSIGVKGMNAEIKIPQIYKDATGVTPYEGVVLYTIECIKINKQWLFKSMEF